MSRCRPGVALPAVPASPRPRTGPTRRQLIVGAGAGALAIASCARPARPPARRLDQPIIVDVHCHDFNASDLPITGFLARTLPGLSELSHTVSRLPELILRKIIGTIHGWINATTPTATEELPLLRAALAGTAGIVPPPPFALPPGPFEALAEEISALFRIDAGALREGLLKLAATLYLVGHQRARIAASLATTYPRVALFAPLLVDYDAWSDDHPASALASQLPPHELIAKLSIRGRIGRADARLHPFVAFDPLREVLRASAGNTAAAPPARPAPRRWEDPAPAPSESAGAIALVRQAVEQAGFIGVKVYPSVGFLPLGNDRFAADAGRGQALDRALRALYALCQAEEIPITAHASPANEYALGYRALAAPERWAPVLREFPGLRLNFGHFGHETGAGGAEGIEAREAWMRQAAELIDGHAHVYADLSGSPLVYDAGYATRFGAHLRSLCARWKRLPARLMYGSDWWLNRFDPGAETAVEAFERRLESWLGSRAREAIMGRNALRFLGFIDEDDRLAQGNRNHQRLRNFYAAETLPAWLG